MIGPEELSCCQRSWDLLLFMNRWWVGSGWMDGWYILLQVSMVRQWPRKATHQCVHCAVLRSCFWMGLIKEVS